MRPTTIALCCLPAVLAGSLCPGTSITGPVAGYVADSDGPVLRTIFGVPGSFRFSDPLALPDGVTQLRIAPGQDYALAEVSGSSLSVLSLSGGAASGLTALEWALPSPDWIAFSPQSQSAVLFSATSRRLQIIAGLPDRPQVALDLDSSVLPDIPRMASVSDDGKTLLVASRRAIYLLPPDGSTPRTLLTATQIVSLALFRDGTSAAVWDGVAGAIHLLQNVTSAPSDRVLVSGWKGAGTLYPSADGGTLFLVRPGAKSVFAHDVASGSMQSFESPASARTLDPLRNHDTFLISADRHQPGWIFYLDGTAGHVVFVPSPTPATEDGQ
ncbi:MAG TPA: hypothetical protein VKU19_25845 [Bryobacteraceae bacterium]|nr:hypothetical protein [Bryobacteraceae bacterium]